MISDLINFYRVEDLQATRKFYGELLNFPLFKDQGKCLIYDLSHGKLGFCSHFPSETASSSCITLVFSSREAVDKIYESLRDASIVIHEKPSYNAYFKIYHFFCEDPNGLKIECQVFEE